ncbi:MAG: hypothetical protein WKF58_15275 [Ilumatobacteraceae bacterium]
MRAVPALATACVLAAAVGCSNDGDGGGATTVERGDAAVPAALAGDGPTTEDHWHIAYAFNLCNPDTGEQQLATVEGDKEIRDESGAPVGAEPKYAATGVHSHDDGVIHWHAISSQATGANATLGVFLDVYDVELTDSSLVFPADQGGGLSFSEGDTMCGDEPGQLSVTVWPDYADTERSVTVTEGLADIPVTRDDSVFVISVAPEGAEIGQPSWAADLPELGARDGG